jgi:predicted RNA-binding protein with PIN domain
MEAIIDGYNLMMKIGRLASMTRAGGLHRARETLLHFLSRSNRPELRGATVVFDARHPPEGSGLAGPEGLSLRRERRGQLGVIFAPRGSDADTVIKDLVEERSAVGKARSVLLVTSDRQVASYARGLGARIETSEECARHLASHGRPRHGRPSEETAPRPGDPEKELAGPPDDEIDSWLRYFGMAEDETIEF